jgi:hypothetical protein
VAIGGGERAERQGVGGRDQDGRAVERSVRFVRYLDLKRRGTDELERDLARATFNDQLGGGARVPRRFDQ